MPAQKIKAEIFLLIIAVLFGLPAQSPAQTNDEVAEAVRFLNSAAAALSKLKIYKLAETDIATVAPQIADKLVTSGKKFRKLNEAANKVLEYHGLSNHCTLIVFEFDVPTVFTYQLRSISFSSKALEILSKDEITALTAHEIGHLYFAKELGEARIKEDHRTARIVELKSDAVALMTLKALRIKPENLISALAKLIEVRKESGFGDLSVDSPSIENRRALSNYFQKNFKNTPILKKKMV